MKARWDQRRALGYPYWSAASGTLNTQLSKIRASKKYKEAHRDKYAAYQATTRARRKQKYGGQPERNLSARIKWLEAKEQKSQAEKKQRERVCAELNGRKS